MTANGRSVCVVGAGLSGLAAVRGLARAGHDVTCFEAGSAIGGMWRYENDNRRSAAYASLCANTSRRRMRFPSLPLPDSVGEFMHHSELLAYLERYAEVNDLARHITCGAAVERARPVPGGWEVTIAGAGPSVFEALVVATGHYWDPDIPALPGSFSGTILHARDYRTPDRFAGQRVVVVGAAQSALDIAAEVSGTAQSTVLACRQGHHLVPRYVLGRPFDHRDTSAALLVPLPVVRSFVRALLWAGRASPDPGELPPPRHPVFESRWPVVVSPAIQRALSERAFACRAGVSRLDGERVILADGSDVRADTVIFATGYRINFPFLPAHLGQGQHWQFPLYRRILSPAAESLAFIGVLEPGPGLPEIVERQSAWLGEVLGQRLPVPDHDRMWLSIDAGGERRSRRQFGDTGPHTLLCNRHAYLRLLARDLRRGRRHRVPSPTRAAARPAPSPGAGK